MSVVSVFIVILTTVGVACWSYLSWIRSMTGSGRFQALAIQILTWWVGTAVLVVISDPSASPSPVLSGLAVAGPFALLICAVFASRHPQRETVTKTPMGGITPTPATLKIQVITAAEVSPLSSPLANGNAPEPPSIRAGTPE